jgi:LacI family transcriptional regulator
MAERRDARPGPQPTIFDVARVADASIATVSRVVNESGYVSQQKRGRILRAIRELDFTPSTSARSLNTRRTRAIGFVVSSIAHPYSAEVVRGIQDVATGAGYLVSVCSTDGRADLQVAALTMLHGHRVDAVIATPPESEESDRCLDRLARRGTVVVLVGRHLSHPQVDTVTTDTGGGAADAMAHLLDLGHRRIGYLGTPNHRHGSRFAAYRAAHEAAGIPFDESLARSTDLTLESGYRTARTLLAEHPRPTAIFCIDDLVALGVLQAASEAGLRVPLDLSIVGFDDDLFARFVHPPLTTVAQPSFDVGRTAAERALLRLHASAPGDGADSPSREVVRLPCQLVVRGSTGAAPVPARRRPARVGDQHARVGGR